MSLGDSAVHGHVMSGRSETGEPRAGLLSKAFVVLAFLNFLVGASLGGWMASDPSLWGYVSPIHGELNPFGFLSLLIYGMTYAVLQMLAGLTPPKAWIGVLHVFVAECGVVVVVIALLGVKSLLLPGLALQTLAPIVFLVNILSAVTAKRRGAAAQNNPEEHRYLPTQASTSPLLSRHPLLRPTDKIAQRGTDVSLMLFIVGCIWLFVLSARYGEGLMQAWDGPHSAGFLLVAYGWIAGTVLAVSLHLFPRFLGSDKFSAKSASVGQIAWGIGVVVAVVGVVSRSGTTMFVGDRLLGLSILWFSVVFLRALWTSPQRTSSGLTSRMHAGMAAHLAWSSAWLFFLALGVSLIVGLPPTSIPALHMLFLGFSASLVYGVGYALFPRLFGRRDPHAAIAVAQVIVAVLGALLMVTAFILQLYGVMGGSSTDLLMVGGICAATAAVVFLLTWPMVGRR